MSEVGLSHSEASRWLVVQGVRVFAGPGCDLCFGRGYYIGGGGGPLSCPSCRMRQDVRQDRRGEATNREAQAPLPASVSATPEGSQRGRSE